MYKALHIQKRTVFFQHKYGKYRNIKLLGCMECRTNIRLGLNMLRTTPQILWFGTVHCPLVMTHIALARGHRNSEFFHEKM